MNRGQFLKAAIAAVALPYIASAERAAEALAALDSPVAATAEATTIAVDSARIARVGDIVRIVSTGETVRVTAVQAGAWSVVRGIGAVPPSPIARNDEVYIVASGSAEGASLRRVSTTDHGRWLEDKLEPRVTYAA